MEVRSVHHESPQLGSMERHERGPHPAMRGALLRLTGYQHQGGPPARRREVAQDCVTIILSLGASLRVGGPGQPEAEVGSFVAPLADRWAVTEEHGSLCGIQVDLTPLGARRLFGVPMHELSGRLVLPLEDLLGADAGRLADSLHGTPGWPARLDRLEAVLARRILAAPPPRPDVAWAWSRLTATGGRLAIGRLTAELGCSRRHLGARFREAIGPTPKTAARLLRFQSAVRRLEQDDGARFAEIAADCGYVDQPHLNREFRRLAGATPGEFVARRLPDGLGIAA